MTGQDSYQEKELLMRVDKGDEQAFSLIFARHHQKIYSFALRLTESPVYAEEIVQDVFLKIWLRQGQLSGIDDFPAYLYVMARNHTYNYLKIIAKYKVVTDQVEVFLPADKNSPEYKASYKDYTAILQQAIGSLSPQQSQIYRLTREQGLSREEIATLLGLSSETVKAHLARAVRNVRAYVLARMPSAVTLLTILYYTVSGF